MRENQEALVPSRISWLAKVHGMISMVQQHAVCLTVTRYYLIIKVLMHTTCIWRTSQLAARAHLCPFE